MKKALIIGINYIGTENELGGCINDANRLKQFLEQKQGFTGDQITILTDDPQGEDQSKKPTKANIISHFNQLILNAKSGDYIFFSFSGHGASILDKNYDEEDGHDETIVPLDFKTNGLIVDDWFKSMVNLLPKNVKMFALLDSCFSGTGFDLKYLIKQQGSDTSYSLKASNKYSTTKAEVVMLSGCRDNQTSVDTVVSGIPTGALTQSFLEVSINGNISYSNLLKKIRKYIKSKNLSDQIPQLSFGKLIDLDVLVF